MKKSIMIGPIQKAKPTAKRAEILRDRLTKMKVGNFFEISGISSKSEIRNIRAALTYFSKKENVKVATSTDGNILKVEKIGDSHKTNQLSKVK